MRLLAKGPEAAEQAGETLLPRLPLNLWRRALKEGPAEALPVTLTHLRIDDGLEPASHVIWASAISLASSPRPNVRLLALNAGRWPRRISEDRLICHGPNTQNGPHAASIEQHTHHALESTGSACAACHMPAIAETLGDVKVRSHTFRLAGADGGAEDSECLQSLSHGQDERLGDGGASELERSLAVAFAVR